MSLVIVREDTGEYLVSNAPHPRAWEWEEDPDQFFTKNINNAATFGTTIWTNEYIHRCPVLCTLADKNSMRDHEWIVAYGVHPERIGCTLPVMLIDPLPE